MTPLLTLAALACSRDELPAGGGGGAPGAAMATDGATITGGAMAEGGAAAGGATGDGVGGKNGGNSGGTDGAAAAGGGGTDAGSFDTDVAPVKLLISPTSAEFPETTAGELSDFRDFTVTSVGGGPSGPLNALLDASSEGAFRIVVNECAVPLGPADTCVLRVVFTPKVAGEIVGRLTVSASPGGTVFAMLRGSAVATGSGARLILAPIPIFPSRPVGSVDTHTLFLRNRGDAATGPISFTTAQDSDQFVLDPLECAQPLPAANGLLASSCAFKVTFAPRTPGPKVLALKVSARPGGDLSGQIRATATPQP